MQIAYKYNFTFLLIFLSKLSFGQSIAEIKSATEKSEKIEGAINLNASYNTGLQYINAFNYFASGTINLKFKDLNIPISGNYSDRKFQYSLPYEYNYISINPRYKWATANIGTSFMQFSPYSLNGHQYRGVGAVLMPGKWQIKTMYGRLFKANESTDSSSFYANFKRNAFGTKVKYNGNVLKIGMSIFQAKDDTTTLTKTILKPQAKQNLIIGAEFGINFSKRLSFNIDFSSSGLIHNLADKPSSEKVTNHILGKFLAKNPSLRTANAFKTNLSYQIAETSSIVGLQYERIDPDYQTLGAYYFVNDYENITLQIMQPMFERRLFFTGNFGFQRDDLAYKNSSQQRRIVGAASINIMPSPRFNTNISYSNFTAYTNIRSAFDEIKRMSTFELLDTLNYRQITQNITGNMFVELGKSEKESHQLNMMVAWMLSANQQGNLVRKGQLSTFTNGSLGYSFYQKPSNFGINVGLNLSENTIGFEKSGSIGPIASLRKGFFKNRFQNTLHFSQIYSSETALKQVARYSNIRFLTALRLANAHQFTINTGYTNGLGFNNIKREFISAMFGYQIRF